MTVATDAGAVARSACADRAGHDPRPRFREPVQPVDRAPRARGQGVLRAGSRARSAPKRSAGGIRAGSSSAAALHRCSSPARRIPTPRCTTSTSRSSASATACNCSRSTSAERLLPAERREYGHASVTVDETAGLFAKLPSELAVWMSHGDVVTELPHRFPGDRTFTQLVVRGLRRPRHVVTASSSIPRWRTRRWAATSCATSSSTCAAVRAPGRRPRSSRRPSTRCAARSATGKVICALSGGVDSAVAATLVHRAVGDQLTCVFVDNGLLRRGEGERVVDVMRTQRHIHLVHVDATDQFLDALAGVIDPEEKRRRIGATFIRVFEEQATRLGDIDFLAQGTLYPGRHRVDVARHPQRHQDQDAPQRRRAAGEPALRARRAAALPVQGRGAQRRTRARTSRGHGVPSAVSRARVSPSGSSAR